MDIFYTVLYTVFPYICLTVFCLGHLYRYVTDRYGWNARSSQFLESSQLKRGSILFHIGILGTLVGHAGGLLIPQSVFDLLGISAQVHLRLAFWSGLAVGAAACAGVIMLLRRRLKDPRVRLNGTANDLFTLKALTVVIILGLLNVLIGRHNVLDTVAPWIRGIITFTPEPDLMRTVPFTYKLHILTAFALLGFSPFSRLVHIWSAPIFYFFRRWVIFRQDTALATQTIKSACQPEAGKS